MARIGTAEWIAAVGAGAASVDVDPAVELTLVQSVAPDRAWTFTVTGGRVTVTPGEVADPDLRITCAPEIAEAIHQGALSPQRAFLDGQLRIGGDLRILTDQRAALQAIDRALRAG